MRLHEMAKNLWHEPEQEKTAYPEAVGRKAHQVTKEMARGVKRVGIAGKQILKKDPQVSGLGAAVKAQAAKSPALVGRIRAGGKGGALLGAGLGAAFGALTAKGKDDKKPTVGQRVRGAIGGAAPAALMGAAAGGLRGAGKIPAKT